MPRSLLAIACVLVSSAGPALAAGPDDPIRLAVDLTDAPRRMFHARESIPAAPGRMRLLYPKWIPGEHGPTGPIADLAGVEITARGERVAWQRDPLDMYAFDVEVPAGASALDVRLDYLAPPDGGQFTSGSATSAQVAVLSWNTVLLYPAGRPVASLRVEPSLRLPSGWQAGTALRPSSSEGASITYGPVSLETLVDSPVAAGAHYRVVVLSDGEPEHRLHLVADSAEALEIRPATLDAFKKLIAEVRALFGASHYRHYDFLLTLSDHVESFGLEHHESSDDRLPERALIDDDMVVQSAGLLPHEVVHSWNGKYRRPQGLATSDYHQPFDDDLLWVYEGLTSYLGEVLTVRSGLWSIEQGRESLALIAAGMAHVPGRKWRPLGDTARAAQVLFPARGDGSAWRRGVDFYDEGVLLWLEVDGIIRRESKGRASLDDFCRRFYGPPSGPPEVKPYTRDDLIAALEATASYDWKRFLAERVDALRPGPPTEGLVETGWTLTYSEQRNEQQRLNDKVDDRLDLRFSLGLNLVDDSGDPDHGRILDVVPGLPAARAGVAPGMRLVAIDGRRFTPDVVRASLREAQAGRPIDLLVENAEFFATHTVEYRDGPREPHLTRDDKRTDTLEEIYRPRTGSKKR